MSISGPAWIQRLIGCSHTHVHTALHTQMKETPLIRAAHNGHLHTVRFLLESGADVNAIDLASGICRLCTCVFECV